MNSRDFQGEKISLQKSHISSNHITEAKVTVVRTVIFIYTEPTYA